MDGNQRYEKQDVLYKVFEFVMFHWSHSQHTLTSEHTIHTYADDENYQKIYFELNNYTRKKTCRHDDNSNKEDNIG